MKNNIKKVDLKGVSHLVETPFHSAQAELTQNYLATELVQPQAAAHMDQPLQTLDYFLIKIHSEFSFYGSSQTLETAKERVE